ncbi:MAG TPA: C25 family cysteine peptidase, partial [Pyrinomonadaceae bacterium]
SLNFGAATSPRTARINLTIDAGTTLALSTAAGGDIKIGGNWTRAGTFTPNNRAVFFNGSGAQTITVSPAGSETFNYLVIDKLAGSMMLNSSPATSVLVNATAGDVFQLLSASNFDLNGQSLTMQNNGGNLLVSGGIHVINGSGNFDFTGSKTVTQTGGGTLVFDGATNVTALAAVNFGAGLTTINGTLTLGSGGSVNTNPPTYGSSSTLIYDCTCVYGRSAEWSATSGPGYPNNVTVKTNTDVNIGNTTPATPRQIAGTLNAKSGGNFLMDHPSSPMTAAVTVLKNVLIESGGGLHLSTSSGGDLHVQGDFTNDGTFTHNNRAVFFEGGATGNVNAASGTLTMPYVRINKSGGTVLLGNTNLTTLGDAGGNSLDITSGTLTLNSKMLTLGSTVNFAAGTGLIGDTNATLSLQDGGTPGAMGTLIFASGGQSLGNLNINRTGAAGSATVGSDLTLQSALTLTAGDILTGAFTLTHHGASSGTTDVVGNVRRTDLGGTVRQFGNPNNQISFQTGSAPGEITVNLVKSVPSGSMGFPVAVKRTYTITPTGGSGYTATLRLHYNDSDLNGNLEAALDFWRFNGTTWNRIPKLTADPLAGNWIESPAVTQFSPWTLSAMPLAPTAVKLASFEAESFADGVEVRWRSGFEVDNLGYNLYRELGGRRTLVNESLIAGSALRVGEGTVLAAGGAYEWFDREGSTSARYWLEALDLNGELQTFGPIVPLIGKEDGKQSVRRQSMLLSEINNRLTGGDVAQRGWPVSSGGDAAASRNVSVLSKKSVKLAQDSAASVERQWQIANGTAVKIQVNRAGWYRVTQEQLIGAGLDPNSNLEYLQLYADGVEQSMRVSGGSGQGARLLGEGGSIEFYGTVAQTATTGVRTYWLVSGTRPGKRITLASRKGRIASQDKSAMQPVAANGLPEEATDGSSLLHDGRGFDYTVERKERRIYFSSLLNGEKENFYGRVVSTQPVTQALTVRNLVQGSGDGQPQSARLEVALQGVSAGQHQVRVFFNDVELGKLTFADSQSQTAKFNLPAGLVKEGDNLVKFAIVGGTGPDVSLTDYVRLTYAHKFTADTDVLRLRTNTKGTLRIDGFTSPLVRVFDVSDPANVFEIPASPDPVQGASHAVLIESRFGRELLATTEERAEAVSSLAPNRVSAWHTAEHEADLLILTHGTLLGESVEALKAKREEQGMRVSVVDVEDVFDEFSYGAHSPAAIKDFLRWTTTHWKSSPAYLLLLGDASLDPKNYMGRGQFDLVPTKLIDTINMETASDDWLADFDDDGTAEMFVGRLPVRTAAEANLVVSKIVGFTSGATSNTAVLVSDNPRDGYDFAAASQQAQGLLPAGMEVTSIKRADGTAESVRNRIVQSINLGPQVVSFFGHGSTDVWTGDGLLRGTDAANLTNGNRLPLFVMMTCLNGYYQDPALDSLSESLLKAREGGAIAVWASSGMTVPNEQEKVNRELYRQLFGAQGLTLGEAIGRAKQATEDNNVRRTWILFGDPTLKLR